MKINAQQEFDLGQYKGSVVSDQGFQAFVSQSNELGRQIVTAVANNLTFTDNMLAVKKTINLTHGTDLVIRNPLPNNAPITGIIVDGCQGLALDSTGKPTSSTYDLGYPSFRWKKNVKADGSVIVNATYPPPSGYCELANTSTQSIPTGVNTAATFNTPAQLQLSSGKLIFNGVDGIVAGATGIVQVFYQASFAATAAGAFRQSYITLDGTSRHAAIVVAPPSATQPERMAAAEMWDVTVGSTIQLFLGHDAGAPLSTAVVAGLPVRLSAKYVDVLPGTVGAVDLIFIGG